MPELAAANPQPASAYPQWIEPTLQITWGRDPLGLQTITIDRILPKLVPGILALSRRARYFSFYPFLLREYREQRLAPSNRALSDFIKAREFEYAVAVQLCPRGCGTTAAASVGTQRATPAARPVAEGAPLSRSYSVESHMGGYGLYYRTPLVDLGVVAPMGTALGENPTPVDLITEQGVALAEAFRAAIADTAYYKRHMRGVEPIPAEVLRELSERACLCRLSEAPGEQGTIRRTMLPVQERGPDDVQRRRSFAFFLRLVEQAPAVAEDEPTFRRAIWRALNEAKADRSAWTNTAAQWAALAAKEYLQEGFSSIWSMSCRLGHATQPTEGFRPDELRRFIRTHVVGSGVLRLEREVAYAPEVPTVTFAAAVATASRETDLEDLRGWAQREDTAVAGLALLFALVRRLPDGGTMPSGWLDIGLQRSNHQPGLLGFARLLADHLADAPSLADTLEWLVSRYIIDAHEAIAYSKLPNYTFRFRWERGRLRFFDPGYSRVDITDNRRDALSRLSHDLGLWERSPGEPARLTELGGAFVASVFR